MRILLILITLISGPAVATDICHDLWYTRNGIINQAGYCFGSTLGQTMFDNSDCTGKTINLTQSDVRKVNDIKSVEADLGCRVDTKSTYLDIDDLTFRRQLVDLPIPDTLGSACLGWLGDTVPLYAGHHPNHKVIGQINTGDYISFGHWSVGAFTYITTSGPNWVVRSGGWTNASIPIELCRDFAG